MLQLSQNADLPFFHTYRHLRRLGPTYHWSLCTRISIILPESLSPKKHLSNK